MLGHILDSMLGHIWDSMLGPHLDSMLGAHMGQYVDFTYKCIIKTAHTVRTQCIHKIL